MRKFLLISCVVLAAASMACADVLTFDNLPAPALGGSLVPNGYGGLNWDNFWYLDSFNNSYPSPSGYLFGNFSQSNVGFNGFENPATIITAATGTFDFDSGFFTGAWNNGLTVTVQGFFEGNLLYSTQFVVGTFLPSYALFGWTGLDTLTIVGSGGVDAGYGGHGTHVVMDNLDITVHPIPEPASLVLMGTGLLALARKLRKA